MFLLRSAFWLTVMFIIIAPKDFNLGKTAGEASQRALEAGQDAIVAQILATDCDSLECAGGKAAMGVLAGSKLPSIDRLLAPSNTLVPLPRPRPDRMG